MSLTSTTITSIMIVPPPFSPNTLSAPHARLLTPRMPLTPRTATLQKTRLPTDPTSQSRTVQALGSWRRRRGNRELLIRRRVRSIGIVRVLEVWRMGRVESSLKSHLVASYLARKTRREWTASISLRGCRRASNRYFSLCSEHRGILY